MSLSLPILNGSLLLKREKTGKVRFTGISGHGGYLVDCVNYALDHDMIDLMLTAYNFGQDPVLRRTNSKTRLDSYAEELPKAISRAKSMDVGESQ